MADVFRTAAEEDGSSGCNFLLLRRKIGFLLKIEKEMVEYWTKDTKVFKEVQNMPARTKIIAAYPSLSPAERQHKRNLIEHCHALLCGHSV